MTGCWGIVIHVMRVQVSRSPQPELSSLAEQAETWCPVLALLLRRQALHKIRI